MELGFSAVLPHPLEEMSHAENSFWHHGSHVFKSGKNYEIIAPSGKGKTTMLDIIFGRRRDFSGQYTIDGIPSAKVNLNHWANYRSRHLSYVFQGLRLFRHLTGKQNIDIKNRLTQTLSNDRIKTLAQILDIENQLDKKAGLMSYGQQQRLAIIRAMAQPFEWLLLDEPFSHLDPATARKAAELIAGECENRSANFIITRLSDESYLSAQEQIVL